MPCGEGCPISPIAFFCRRPPVGVSALSPGSDSESTDEPTLPTSTTEQQSQRFRESLTSVSSTPCSVAREDSDIVIVPSPLRDAIPPSGSPGYTGGVLAVPVADRLFGHKILDRKVKKCTVCAANFTLLRRRHYCRKCGGIICNSCGHNERQLWTGGPTVRVCTTCAAPKVLELAQGGVLSRVFEFLSIPDLAVAYGSSRAFRRPVHLPFTAERISSIHDEYGQMKFLQDGGFASVHATTDRRTGRRVAVKTIAKKGIRNLSEFVRITREIELHCGSVHPNVVRVERVCQTEHHIYVVMELATGDLFTWLTKHKASEGEVMQLGAQLLGALAYLHEERRLIHRDIKLENLLTFPPAPGSTVPTIKVCDFGFARSVSAFAGGLPASPVASEPRLEPVTPCGTNLYFPPELLRGVANLKRGERNVMMDASQLHKMDVFSAGVVLHFLLRRREPFRGGRTGETAALIEKGLHWPAAGSKEHGANASELARSLITDLLAADPAARPDARRAMQRALDAAAAAAGAVSPADSPLRP